MSVTARRSRPPPRPAFFAEAHTVFLHCNSFSTKRSVLRAAVRAQGHVDPVAQREEVVRPRGDAPLVDLRVLHVHRVGALAPQQHVPQGAGHDARPWTWAAGRDARPWTWAADAASRLPVLPLT